MTLRKNDCSIIIDMFKNLGRSSSWWRGQFSRNFDENFNFDTWYEVKNFFDGDILKERPKIRKENVFLIRKNSNKKLKILYMSIPSHVTWLVTFWYISFDTILNLLKNKWYRNMTIIDMYMKSNIICQRSRNSSLTCIISYDSYGTTIMHYIVLHQAGICIAYILKLT